MMTAKRQASDDSATDVSLWDEMRTSFWWYDTIERDNLSRRACLPSHHRHHDHHLCFVTLMPHVVCCCCCLSSRFLPSFFADVLWVFLYPVSHSVFLCNTSPVFHIILLMSVEKYNGGHNVLDVYLPHLLFIRVILFLLLLKYMFSFFWEDMRETKVTLKTQLSSKYFRVVFRFSFGSLSLKSIVKSVFSRK